jgi:ribosome maturation factor RimP
MREEVAVGQAEDIRDLVAPAVAAAGLELWDVEVSRALVRVLVDRPGGIDLDSLAGVAAEVVSPILDQHPHLTPEENFQLEVSSPGLERTLRTPEQFSRYIGSEVTVKMSAPVAGSRRHHGNLVAAGAGSIRLAVKDAPPGVEVELPLAQIDRARTVLVWGTPADRSSGRGGKNSGVPRRANAARVAAAPDSKESAS